MLFVVDQPELDEMLLARLTSLDEESLARVLASRPDVLDPPWPRRLEDVARRMAGPESVTLAMRGLNRPGFQVLRAIRLVGVMTSGGVRAGEVARWLDADVEEVRPVLEQLADRMLAWPDGDERVRTPPSHDVIEIDLDGLGPSIVEYLPQRTVRDLKELCSALGIAEDGRKADIVDRVLAFFRDPAAITGLLDAAPDGLTDLLAEFAQHGPVLACQLGQEYGYRERRDTPASWAVRHGLLWGNYDGTATMPLEVGLALRGPAYRLPFAPRSPELAAHPVSAEQVSAAASTAALRMVDRICAVLDHAATEPIPLLKTGRVGARAVKALARHTGSTVEEARLAIDLASAMLLLAPVDVEPEPVKPRRGSRKPPPEPLPPPGLVPSERHPVWQGAGSAERLRMALDVWWTLPLAPLADDKVVRSVLGGDPSAAFADVRQRVIRLLAGLPDGTGAAGETSLAEFLGWHAPLIHPDLRRALVGSALAESALLGVTAFGAAGDLAHALLAATAVRGDPIDRDHPDLLRATERLVAAARTTALFGADLTAVVTGAPDAALAALLDRAADRETTGAASTWRFGPASVRRALDGGMTAATLLDELRTVAEKPLPQPLTYLINDVARRHGEVGVLAAGCVVVGERALLTEIAAHRKLAALGLRAVAPTVLVTGAAADTAIAELRAAGYAPVPRDVDGTVAVRRAAEPAVSLPPELTELIESRPAAPNPREHAARLLGTPVRAARPALRRGSLINSLCRGRRKPDHDLLRLAWSLEAGLPTRVAYLEPDGVPSEMVVSDAELDGDAIDVWCPESAGYRRLELARVRPVS